MTSTSPSTTNTIKNSDSNNSDASWELNHRQINEPFNHTQSALLFGISGGVVLGFYQLLVNGADQGINIGVGLLGFLLLTPFLYFGLKQFRQHLAGGEVFKNGIIHGMSISAIASIVMVVIASIGITWQGAPPAIDAEEIAVMQMVANSAFQILVGIVFGMTITFIILQGLKSDIRADKHIEKQR